MEGDVSTKVLVKKHKKNPNPEEFNSNGKKII